MSLFQFNAVVTGWNESQGSAKPTGPSESEFDRMLERSAEDRARALI